MYVYHAQVEARSGGLELWSSGAGCPPAKRSGAKAHLQAAVTAV